MAIFPWITRPFHQRLISWFTWFFQQRWTSWALTFLITIVLPAFIYQDVIIIQPPWDWIIGVPLLASGFFLFFYVLPNTLRSQKDKKKRFHEYSPSRRLPEEKDIDSGHTGENSVPRPRFLSGRRAG